MAGLYYYWKCWKLGLTPFHPLRFCPGTGLSDPSPSSNERQIDELEINFGSTLVLQSEHESVTAVQVVHETGTYPNIGIEHLDKPSGAAAADIVKLALK